MVNRVSMWLHGLVARQDGRGMVSDRMRCRVVSLTRYPDAITRSTCRMAGDLARCLAYPSGWAKAQESRRFTAKLQKGA